VRRPLAAQRLGLEAYASDLNPYVGKKITVIAWFWARTVKSPNPAFSNVEVPLASTFKLSAKTGKETYVEPVIEYGGYRFTVQVCSPKEVETAKAGPKLSIGGNLGSLTSDVWISDEFDVHQG